MTGRAILHYKLLEKLGEGGMGEVWKAEDTQLLRPVALKFLTAAAGGDAEVQARLIREAQATAALDHPNICHVYGIHQTDGETFIAMAFVDGPSLADKIKERPLPLEEALDLAMQIAKGLEEAHAKAIVHRDIKPANVMLTAKGQAKIMDFGLAAQADRSKITKEGTTLGTPAYMPPEQLEAGAVDRRADLWALGCVLYEMLTQRTPFEADYEQAIAYGILNEDPEPVTAQRAGLPPQIDDILDKALAKDPDERYQTAAGFLADLKRLRSGKVSKRTVHPTEPVPAQPPKSAPWKGIAAVVGALVVAGAAYWWTQRPAGIDPTKLTEVVLTSYQGEESSPTFNPDGTQIAYARRRSRDQPWNIYVEVVGSGQPRAVIESPADDRNPAWSPDGRSIAFWRQTDTTAEVLVAPALGGPERSIFQIENKPFGGAGPRISWSPDSQRVVFGAPEEADGQLRLALVEVGSGDLTWLTAPPEDAFGDDSPAFSTDGSDLAFVRRQGFSSGLNIWRLSLTEDYEANGDPEQVTFFERRAQGPAWSPDGTEIFFIGEQGRGREGIWRIPAEGGETELIWRREDLGGSSRLSVSQSPEGNLQIAFGWRELHATDIYRYDLVGPNRGKPVKILSSSRRDSLAAYSPDGKWIAYNSGWPVRDIYVCEVGSCELDGSTSQRITFHEARVTGPIGWSPDSSKIAWHSRREGAADIFVVDRSGGEPVQLTSHPADDANPKWSPDGEWVYFWSPREPPPATWRVPATGGNPERVTEPGSYLHSFSPDGSFFYVRNHKTGELLEYPISGQGKPRKSSLPDEVSRDRFFPMPSGVYWAETEGGMDSGRLKYYSHADQTISELFEVSGYMGSLHPDETSILTVYGPPPGADLAMLTTTR